jgi:PH/SEC7 domain-containing protein
MDFFQAGTDELVQEWVLTCNYWAARRSRPPLPGGVTNAEYGWRSLESQTDDTKDDTVSLFSNKSSKSKLSFQNTISRRNTSIINIADWQAPQASLVPSQLDEEAQLESLQKHLDILVKELKQHKTYQEALSRLVSDPDSIRFRIV